MGSTHHRSRRAAQATAAAVIAGALTLTACGGDSDDNTGGTDSSSPAESTVKLPKLDGQTLEVAAVWTGPEQANFTKVLDEFETVTTLSRQAAEALAESARRISGLVRRVRGEAPATAEE